MLLYLLYLSTYHLPVFCLHQAGIMTLIFNTHLARARTSSQETNTISKTLALIIYYLINSFYSIVSNYPKIVFRIISSFFGSTIQRPSIAFSCHIYLVSFNLELSQHITFLVMNGNDIFEVPASCLVVCPTVWITHSSNFLLLVGFRLNILARILYR